MSAHHQAAEAPRLRLRSPPPKVRDAVARLAAERRDPTPGSPRRLPLRGAVRRGAKAMAGENTGGGAAAAPYDRAAFEDRIRHLVDPALHGVPHDRRPGLAPFGDPALWRQLLQASRAARLACRNDRPGRDLPAGYDPVSYPCRLARAAETKARTAYQESQAAWWATGRAMLFGCRDVIDAPWEPIKPQAADALWKRLRDQSWRGGNLQYWNVHVHTPVPVPLDQALWVLGGKELRDLLLQRDPFDQAGRLVDPDCRAWLETQLGLGRVAAIGALDLTRPCREHLVRQLLPALPAPTSAEQPNTEQVAPPKKPSAGRGRGRPPSPMSGLAAQKIFEWLDEWGAPAPADGQMAVLERHIAAFCEGRGVAGETPSESTIRAWVKKGIGEWKRREAEAGNSK